MNDAAVSQDQWEYFARVHKDAQEAERQRALDELAALYTAKNPKYAIEGLPANPYDPESGSLAYKQGAYKYKDYFGAPIWGNGKIIGYEFIQHDVGPGLQSVIRTDLSGNVADEFVMPMGEDLDIGATIKQFLPVLAMAIPGAGPWISAALAADAASRGEWEQALLSGLGAAVPLAGQLGASAETVSTLNNVRQAANVLKALESKDLLGLAMSGANLAKVTEVGGYSMKDINQAIGMVKALQSEDPMAIIKAGAGYLPKGTGVDGPSSKDFEKDSFDYNQIFDPKTAGSVDLSEKPYDPNYKFTTDFSVGADYSLAPKEDGLGFKVTAPPEVFNEDGSVNYELFDYDALSQLGMDMPKSPNIDGMGGGQGLRLPVEGGYITEQGFIPEGYTPDLGDPNSFINKPAPGGDVSIKGALDAGAKATLADMNKKPGAAKPPAKPGTSGQDVDFNQLMSLLGGGQQAAPMVVSSGQDNSADVQLMENIFGPSLSAPPAGDPNEQARELARLLRS